MKNTKHVRRKKATRQAESLDQLIESYCKSANALVRYRRYNDFEPGTIVIAQYRDDSPRLGIIAPYGEMWSTVDHMSVPVIFDSGRMQPWSMSYLTIQDLSPRKTNTSANKRKQ